MQIILNIIYSFSIYLLISHSFSIIYFSTKIFHFAHAGIITIGAYLVFLFSQILSLPFIVSIIFSLIGSVFISILFELIIYKNLRKKHATPLVNLVASIGLYVVLQNCISIYFGDTTKMIFIDEITVGHKILGGYITTVQIITIISSLILFSASYLFLRFSLKGKSIRAVGSNPELSDIYGISSNNIILYAFGIGSVLGAISGILSAMDSNMTPTFGFNLFISGVVAMIIGGVGSTGGLIAGSLLVATSQHLAAYYIDTKWIDAVTFLILILFLLWKPLGFSGKRLKKVEL